MDKEREKFALKIRELLRAIEDEEVDLTFLMNRYERIWYSKSLQINLISRIDKINERLDKIESKCCGTQRESDNKVHLITGLDINPKSDISHLHKWLKGTNQLTIVDPYFFSFNGTNKIYRTQSQYIETLQNLLPKTLKSLEIFHLPGPNKEIRKRINQHCLSKGIEMKSWETTEIHDRVLIKNKQEAIALGTSFGGLGNKIAFILDLPNEDLHLFRRELNRVKNI